MLMKDCGYWQEQLSWLVPGYITAMLLTVPLSMATKIAVDL